jgi:hypothetical protein
MIKGLNLVTELLRNRTEGGRMPVVKVTGQGLSAIALSVALLWGCWIGERVTMMRATEVRVRALRDLDKMRQRRSIPAAVPARGKQKRSPQFSMVLLQAPQSAA